MTIMRIVLLLVSYCCAQSSWAALYSVFALISAVYAFDPVGLFLSGRTYTPYTDGNLRTLTQNICCVLAFALSLATSYVGYLFTGELQK